jgi:SpoVK/Ycf46/Vps4 family AAA+-type ATPase
MDSTRMMRDEDSQSSGATGGGDREVLADKLADMTHGFVPRDLVRARDFALLHGAASCLAGDNDADEGDEDTRSKEDNSVGAGLLPTTPSEWLRQHLALGLTHVRTQGLSGSTAFAAKMPHTPWSLIGGYGHVKRRLELFAQQLTAGDAFARLGISDPSGVLLHGPSGCGKSLLVQALAFESNLTLVTVSGSDLYSKWLGDSEAAVRRLFRQAAEQAPCLVLLDELDSIAPSRDDGAAGGVGNRLLSTLLNELDGVTAKPGVLVVGCTNRLEAVDAALIRPGRFSEHIRVELPNQEERLEILRCRLAATPVTIEVPSVLAQLAAETTFLTGADLAALCREAGVRAIRTHIEREQQGKHVDGALSSCAISGADLRAALRQVRAVAPLFPDHL